MLRIIQTEHQLSTTINCHWYLSLLILLIKAYCVSLSLIDGASIIYFLSTEQVLFQARKKIIDLFIKNNMESEEIFEVYRIVDKRTELGKVNITYTISISFDHFCFLSINNEYVYDFLG